MPLLELKLRSGRLDEAEIEQLTTELSRAAIEAEGSDLERAGSMTWTLVDTFSDGEWRVGGEPAGGPTYLVRANLVGELVDDADKARFVDRANEAICAVDPTYDPSAAWVIVTELTDGNWGAAGTVMSSEDLAEIMGVEQSDGQRA